MCMGVGGSEKDIPLGDEGVLQPKCCEVEGRGCKNIHILTILTRCDLCITLKA